MQVHITLDVPEYFKGDPEGELKRAVVEHVGKIVSDRIEEEVQSEIVNAAMAMATEKIDAVIGELLLMPIQATNSYGEPKGQAKTLREAIIDHATTWLTHQVNSQGEMANSYTRDPYKTRIAWYAQKVAADAVDKELKETIAAAVTEIRGSVKVRAKDLLADAVAKILEQKG